jgi:hypothetical protein
MEEGEKIIFDWTKYNESLGERKGKASHKVIGTITAIFEWDLRDPEKEYNITLDSPVRDNDLGLEYRCFGNVNRKFIKKLTPVPRKAKCPRRWKWSSKKRLCVRR